MRCRRWCRSGLRFGHRRGGDEGGSTGDDNGRGATPPSRSTSRPLEPSARKLCAVRQTVEGLIARRGARRRRELARAPRACATFNPDYGGLRLFGLTSSSITPTTSRPVASTLTSRFEEFEEHTREGCLLIRRLRPSRPIRLGRT